MYIGTDSATARRLLGQGTDVTPCHTIEQARLHATAAALQRGGLPVVLKVSSAAFHGDFFLASQLSVAEVDRRPLVDRLPPLGETADLGGALTGLLSLLHTVHNHVVNVVKTGKGESDAQVSDSLQRLRDAARRKLDGDGDDEYRGGLFGKPAKLKKKKVAPKPIGKQHLNTINQIQQKMGKISQGINTVHKTVKKAARVAKPARVVKPSTVIQRPKPMKAKTHVTVRGTINGKPSSTTVKQGTSYHLLKGPSGTSLRRRGGRGVFIVHPKDLGKLK